MDIKKPLKEGMTVQEIENIAKKYRFELVFCLSFILAGIFSYLFGLQGWSIFLAVIGGVVGVCLPAHAEKWLGRCFQFLYKQERMTQIIIGIAVLVLSIFISPIIFFVLSILGGVEIHHNAHNPMSQM
jgi:membrane associated rhomboid family serine protease